LQAGRRRERSSAQRSANYTHKLSNGKS
jgi:hypothetical protein